MSRYLPEEIMTNILSRLPAKSIQRFRCVCKSWIKLFSNPNFIKLHLKHASQRDSINLLIRGEDRRIYIARDVDSTSSSATCIKSNQIDYAIKGDFYVHCLGSCNGLVCLDIDETVIAFWNPTTNECKEISVPETCFKRGFLVCGLGYDSNNDDYKFIMITYINYPISMSMEANVYSLRSDSWKTFEYNTSYNFILGNCRYWCGVYFNGALHWVGNRTLSGNEPYYEILAFDICNETFNLNVLKPRDFDGYDYPKLKIGVLRDSLCMFMDHLRDSERCIDVWVMKDYGVKESLSKLFTIAVDDQPVEPMHNFNNGDILLANDDYEKTLVSYDPKLKSARMLEMNGVPICRKIATYLESLVSPKLGNSTGPEEDLQEQGFGEHRRVVILRNHNHQTYSIKYVFLVGMPFFFLSFYASWKALL